MSILEWMKKVARKTMDQRQAAPSGAQEDAPAPAHAASVTQRYDNLGEIARGGMGAILAVRDPALRRKVAMKVLEPQDGKTNATRDSLFIEEAQITSQLEHPNIVPIHELGRDENGTPYFTMKLVNGKTLADLLHESDYQATNPRCIRAALDVLMRVCDALAFAHAKGVIHRDLKPENELQQVLRQGNTSNATNASPNAAFVAAGAAAISPAQQLETLLRSSPSIVFEALTRGAQALASEQAPSCVVVPFAQSAVIGE